MNDLFLYSHSKFFRAIYENYGYSLKALWVVCESIRERNYRLKKKNYLSGPTSRHQNFAITYEVHVYTCGGGAHMPVKLGGGGGGGGGEC